MTRTPDYLAARNERVAKRIADAQAAFEAGFLSKAAQKRALDDLNRAYDMIRETAHDAQIDHANADETGPLCTDYQARGEFFASCDLPFDLHQVRDRHVAIIEEWSADHAPVVRDLIALRAAIKAAEIAPAPVNEEKERVEAIRQTIVDEMARRQAQFVEALDLGRKFGGLPVTVSAHWVHGHKGAIFLRHFFYLNGRLTPLNVIIAAAQRLEAEKKQ